MKTAILFLASTAAALAADDSNWPRWRGPSDNGSAGAGAYPVTWSAAANILWKTPLPGKGCSTPIVWNQRILLTAPVDGQDAALAFDWSGRPLWRTVIGPERPGKHRNASGCNPAPATDGGGVFVYFKSGNLAALDLDGKLRWKTNLQERFGKDTLWWDIGTSPALTARDVIIAVMHEGSSYLAAFDKAGGKLRWKVARNFTTALEGDHSYATPLVIRHADREAVLAWGAEHLTAHDAADGRTLWTCGDFNPDQRRNWPAVASPVVAGNGHRPSQLTHWPVQLHLISPAAPQYRGKDVLLAADCVAFAVGDFHKDHLAGKSLAIACPKLDDGQETYVAKLRALIDDARINTLTVMIMQVPSCMGLLNLARTAAAQTSRMVPVKCAGGGPAGRGSLRRPARGKRVQEWVATHT